MTAEVQCRSLSNIKLCVTHICVTCIYFMPCKCTSRSSAENEGLA